MFLLVLASSLAPPAAGADHKVLPIGVAEFPPFKFLDEKGALIGTDTEVVEAVIRRMGYEPRITVGPWSRVQREGQAGEFAAIYSFTKSPERERHFIFTQPINTVKDVFFKMKDRPITWERFEDLAGYRVGVSQGYHYAPEFDRAIEDGIIPHVSYVASQRPELQHFRKLIKGRIDLFICELSVGLYIRKTHAPLFDPVDYIDRPIGRVRTFHAGFSRRWPSARELTEAFNRELGRFIAEGGLAEIHRKYGIITDPSLLPAQGKGE